MSILPHTRLGKVEWAEDHIGPFTTNASIIGLTSGQCTTMGTKTSNARSKYEAQRAAINAAKAATQDFYDAVADLSEFCADLLKDVKAAGATNPAVFPLAEIPAPATPTPIPAPSKPSDFRVEILENGALKTSWKCTTARGAGGTVYQIRRRVGGDTQPYVFIATVGEKQFTDATLPLNSGPVSYEIVAIRSTSSSNPAVFTVTFGTGAAGQTVATIVSPPAGGAPKLAA